MEPISIGTQVTTRGQVTAEDALAVFGAGVIGQALDLVRRHGERLRVLVTQRLTLEQAPEAIELALEHPDRVEKVMLRVSE